MLFFRFLAGYHYLLQFAKVVINGTKLPGPLDVVEEGSEVKTVVVRGIGFRVVGRSQCRHLVAVDGIEAKELLHFFGHLFWAALFTPDVYQFAEHAVRTTAHEAAVTTEDRELFVCQAKIVLKHKENSS